MVKYWLRLHDGKCGDQLLQEALKDNFSLFTNGHACWVKNLHTILKDINMKPKNCKLTDILMIKRCLRNKWNSELNQSEKLRSYKEKNVGFNLNFILNMYIFLS